MRIKPQIFDIICNILCLVLLIGSGVWIILNWGDLPAQIPTHFDFAGNPDAYGSKSTIWIMYGITWAIWLMIFICSFFPRSWNMGVRVAPNNIGRAYTITYHFLHIINLLTVALMLYGTTAMTTAAKLTVVFWVLLALIFAAVIAMIIMLLRLR